MSDSYRKRLIEAVYPENPEILMADDPLHKDAAHVIDRLRDSIRGLEAAYKAVTKTIHLPPGCGKYIITEEQIDAAWAYRRVDAPESAEYALEELGIVVCEKCGGSGDEVGKVWGTDVPCPTGPCPACNGHGWVWKEK